MSVRSEWRLHELLLGEEDPFASVVLTSGLNVDLTGTQEELFEALRRTVEMESRLFEQDVTCDLKDDGQDCLTCALYVADRAEERRAPLCRLGRDQRIIEERHGDARFGPLRELAQAADELSEIGYIEPEYVDLLTFAGL